MPKPHSHLAFQQTLKGQPQLIFKPQLLAGLKLLTLARSELKEKVETELERNPFLEEIPTPNVPGGENPSDYINAPSSSLNSLSLESSLERLAHSEEKSYKATYDEVREQLPSVETLTHPLNSTPTQQLSLSTTTPPPHQTNLTNKNVATIIEETTQTQQSLAEELLLQLAVVYERTSRQYRIGSELISMIDNNGFLKDEVVRRYCQETKSTTKEVNEVLGKIRTFTPVGIAAASSVAALLTQLATERRSAPHTKLPLLALAEKVLKKHFKHLTRKRHTQTLCQALGITPTELATVIKYIGTLEPHPIRNYTAVNQAYIIPDATVDVKNGNLELNLHNDYHHRLRLSPYYLSYWKKLRQEGKVTAVNEDFRTYLNENKQRAESLLTNLAFRESNLEKILNHLLNVQRDVFFKGLTALKPYAVGQLAADLNMDKGMISRLINGKYLMTKWGLIEIRRLLSAIKIERSLHTATTATQTTSEDKDSVSIEKIYAIIKEIIATYPDKRLSDQKIAEMLQLRGYKLARRTVAKYRQKLNILSSFDRS